MSERLFRRRRRRGFGRRRCSLHLRADLGAQAPFVILGQDSGFGQLAPESLDRVALLARPIAFFGRPVAGVVVGARVRQQPLDLGLD